MEEGARTGGISDSTVNNRHSTGCLVVKKKADGVGGGRGYSGPDIVYRRKEKKRPRLVESDSQSSSDELLEFNRRRSGSKLVSTSSSALKYERGNAKDSEFGRSKAVKFARNEVFPEERKRNTLDVYDFDEYDDLEDVKKRYFDTDGSGRILVGRKQFMGRRELDTCSHRRVMMSDRRVPHLRGASSEKVRGGSSSVNGSFDIKSKLPIQALKRKFEPRSDEAIRLQGKNGVLKLMVKNKKVGGSSTAQNFEDAEGSSMSQTREVTPKKAMMRHSINLGKKRLIDQNKVEHIQIDKMKPIKLVQSKSCEDSDGQSIKKEEPTRIASNDAKTRHPTKRGRSETEVASSPERFQASRMEIKIKRGSGTGSKAKFGSGTESKVKRGSGTEKQLLREKIKSILVGAGWTIDYRPRRNRDYFDAVYINPAGTAYWSIIKAYDAFQKQLEEEGAKAGEDCSTTDLISDDVLCKLTRQTQKKLERELKRKKREDTETERKRRAATSKAGSYDSETDSTNSDSEGDKLSSFIKQRGISKQKLHEFRNDSGSRQAGRMQDRTEKSSIPPHFIHGRKTKKIGRCTLLVRSADKGLNSEGSGFVPFKGKRTLLSWLIDSGTVRLSEKVLYMNRRRSRVMLEGWVTRDGIHCGCCSKILTVSKFEMHAASKLHQPYQNICLKSGASLLECQVDAWNSHDDALRRGMKVIDVDGDDPNDDTCGICGDGGNLICCDGCPSTFHQNCLGIEMLPPGDWHCSHCSCKFCGLMDIDNSQRTESMSSELAECGLCERKYHGSCIADMNASSTSFNNEISFCGRKCQELFEQLQKLLGVRHEAESGLSWSLIRCTDLDTDPSHRGFSQKVEWNAKLAVALQVMDECFLPITDRRSGIGLIQSVLYNCRSNFNRLNYGGFCTAVLERGDEIICAASIRIHGTQLAEMPFIGTRHIYRRQGMCRRLLLAIESALRSLKVEKLIIPAISDMMNTWTTVFGFSVLEDLHKQEMKSLNMLVFPGTDMLQKRLVEPPERDILEVKGSDLHKVDSGYSPMPHLTKGSDLETSPGDASVGDSLPRGDRLIEKSDANPSDHSVKESDVGFSLQESAASINAVFLPISSLNVSSGTRAPPRVSPESGNSLSQSHDKMVNSPSNGRNSCVDASKSSVENLTNLRASRESTETDTNGNNAARADAGPKLADDSIVGITYPSFLVAGPEKNTPPTVAEMPESKSYVKEISSSDLSRDTILIANPALDSSTKNDVQAVEFGIDASTNINDKIIGVESALRDMKTSPTAIRSCSNDTDESVSPSKSANLDSAAHASVLPHLKSVSEAANLMDGKTSDSISTLEASVSLASRIAGSDVSDVPKVQIDKAETDSSAMDITRHHKAAEISVGFEGGPTTDTVSLLEAAGFFPDGISASVPCSGSTHESKLQDLGMDDYSELEPQFDCCIREEKSNLMNHGVDGDGPDCNSHGEGSIQMPECRNR